VLRQDVIKKKTGYVLVLCICNVILRISICRYNYHIVGYFQSRKFCALEFQGKKDLIFEEYTYQSPGGFKEICLKLSVI